MGIVQDIRYGFRMLVKNPSFTIIAVLALALGIGANSAIFSVTDQILFRSLPVKSPEQLVVLTSPGPKPGRINSDGDDSQSFSYPLYRNLRANQPDGIDLAARYGIPISVTGNNQTERANGELVSGNYFEVIGVEPGLGRLFTEEVDRVPGGHPLAVLSHRYWTRRFGADPGVIDQTLLINGSHLTIIGITQPEFDGIQIGLLTDVFIPMSMQKQMMPNWDALEAHRSHWLAIIGRLRPGLSLDQAQEILNPIYQRTLEQGVPLMGSLSAETQRRFLERNLVLLPGNQGRPVIQRDTKAPLLILMGMVMLVLLIACANVANLLMARAAARQREMAIRMAIGAGRMRVIRQLLVEGLILSMLGGAAGLLVASWTIGAIIAAIPESVGGQGLSANLDERILAFNFVLSAVTAILFGLMPAIRATRISLEGELREQGSSVSGSQSQVRFRKALVACQVVLTAVLLVGAGLFAKSLNNLSSLDLGIRTENIVAFSLAPDLNGYSPERCVSLFDELRTRLGSMPGVDSVSAAELGVLAGNRSDSNVTVEGYQAAQDENMQVSQNWVGPNFFSLLGVKPIRGREFQESDTATAPKVAVINEEMVRRFFQDRDPIGMHFAFGAGRSIKVDIEIVGIVKDTKNSGVREDLQPFVYLPYSQKKTLGGLTMYVRSANDTASTASAITREVQNLDPSLPVFDLKTVSSQLDESIFNDRFLSVLSMSFAGLAALMASIGLYGVMSYNVTRRTREIGIRIALGATSKAMQWLILREVVWLTALGILLGLPLGYGLGRLAESILFEVKPWDPIVFVATAVLLALATLLGGVAPAYRASRTEPLLALRYE